VPAERLKEWFELTTFGQGLLLSRRLIEAGTRFVEMNWPAVANGNADIEGNTGGRHRRARTIAAHRRQHLR
jgi:hypothetical protein